MHRHGDNMILTALDGGEREWQPLPRDLDGLDLSLAPGLTVPPPGTREPPNRRHPPIIHVSGW
ncbi:hypothetical protein GCM10017556_25890 [Micromonospora sagamiensis]|nr:hypothetical protein GCM10017556_25890 [Micromonospora sagamiensis]